MDVGAVIMTTHEIDQISGMAEVFGRACRRVGGKRVDCARSSCKIDTCPCPNEGAFAILSVQLDVARRMVCWRPSLYELEWATSSKIVFFFSFPSSRARQWSANSTDCGELGVESTRTDLPVPIELIS